MVKFSNKSKGRPSKRKTLKTKYKIERKVKQHRKKLQKEAKKLKGSGLKHKSTSMLTQGFPRVSFCLICSPLNHRFYNRSDLLFLRRCRCLSAS